MTMQRTMSIPARKLVEIGCSLKKPKVTLLKYLKEIEHFILKQSKRQTPISN